jgi:MFS family permease
MTDDQPPVSAAGPPPAPVQDGASKMEQDRAVAAPADGVSTAGPPPAPVHDGASKMDQDRPVAAATDGAGPWRPLRSPMFRSLLIASLGADIGLFMQSAGAAWLLVSLGSTAGLVALVQTAASLPEFLLVIPAGALADIVDRRKLILAAEAWILVASAALAALVSAGRVSPTVLLVLLLLVAVGAALEGPVWQAIQPELVPRRDLSSALALNGIEFNVARAIGPALAGVLLGLAGAGTVFAISAASGLGVIAVIAGWRSTPPQRGVPLETLTESLVAGFRYVDHSPALRGVLLRTGTGIFATAAFPALLPTLAHEMGAGAVGYGLLLASFGVGGILGVPVLPWLRARASSDVLFSAGLATMAFMLAAVASLHSLWLLCVVLLVGGAGWTVVLTVVNTAVQNLAPSWVRGRVLAFYLLVFQAGIAAGSAVWGTLADRTSVREALLAAAATLAASVVLRFRYPLPHHAVDMSPWNHWPTPRLAVQPGLHDGPVLVTLEYFVNPGQTREFKAAMRGLEEIRRRDGALRWDLFADAQIPGRYLETFLVASWAEHLRQHDRFTQADRAVEDRVGAVVQQTPRETHFLHVSADRRRV